MALNTIILNSAMISQIGLRHGHFNCVGSVVLEREGMLLKHGKIVEGKH